MQQLRSTSDTLLGEVRHLRRLEEQKRSLPISSPEFHQAADEVESVSRRIFKLAHDQEVLGDETATSDTTTDEVIVAGPPRTDGDRPPRHS